MGGFVLGVIIYFKGSLSFRYVIKYLQIKAYNAGSNLKQSEKEKGNSGGAKEEKRWVMSWSLLRWVINIWSLLYYSLHFCRFEIFSNKRLKREKSHIFPQ